MTIAAELEHYFDRLQSIWPPRSLSGAGTRASHDILEEASGQKFTRIEVPSGQKVFDWVTPKEWRLRDAYIISPSGERIVDIRRDGHLHIVNYSAPYSGRVSRSELEKHLHSISAMPTAVPYVQKYYAEPPEWGFCIADRDRHALEDGDYQVEIDAEFIDGSLPICELVLPGTSDREILLWAYSCHPTQMAHHDTSANLAWAFLAKRVAAWADRRYTYRFVIGAETIGSLAYLASKHRGPPKQVLDTRGDLMTVAKEQPMARHLINQCIGGFVMTCLGRGAWNYKRTRRGDTLADRAVEYMALCGYPIELRDFYADKGSDELQFCSHGFNLPVGSLMRLPYGSPEFTAYHTSLDDKASISFDVIEDSVNVYERLLRAIETNATYRATITNGMPQLGRRGLYDDPEAITPLIQFSDGATDLFSIAKRTGISLYRLADLAKRAVAAGVLTEA